MIHDYDKWKLIESLGNGEETFITDIDLHGQQSNLDFYNFPTEILGELEGATGKISYNAKVDYNSHGIEDVYFSIEAIELELELRVYKSFKPGIKYGISDDDDEGELVYKEFKITRAMLGTDPKVEVNKLPFYLEEIEIDLKDCVDKDGNIDYKKVKFEIRIGNDND